MNIDPTKINHEHINSIIASLKKKQYVRIIGANGMGKNFLIEKAVPKIQEKIGDCVNIDVENYYKKNNAIKFYEMLLFKLTGTKYSLQDKHDVSNSFIRIINRNLHQEKVLILRNFQGVSYDFYDRFTTDCRIIYTNGRKNSNSGESKLLIIFSGSYFGFGYHETSPLWNITDVIEILPPDHEDSLEEIRVSYLNKGKKEPSKNICNKIYESTFGFRFISQIFVEYIIKNEMEKGRRKFDEIFDSFINYIWKIVNTSEQALDKDEKKIYYHFMNIEAYLRESSDILNRVIDLQNEVKINGAKDHLIDDYTITGIFIKDNDGYYSFSNPIYAAFLTRLLKDFRRGDYCLFHLPHKHLWEKAKNIYKILYENEVKTENDENISPRINHIKHLVLKLVNKFKDCNDHLEFIQELYDQISFFFQIRNCSIYNIDQNEALNPDFLFKNNIKRIQWLDINEINNEFIKNSLKSNSYSRDWTGQFIAIPIIFSNNFKKLFIAKFESELIRWYRGLIPLIQDSFIVYYYLYTKHEDKELIKNLSNFEDSPAVSTVRPHRDEHIKNILPIWEQCKKMFKEIGINTFILHEIINFSHFLSTSSNEEELVSASERKKIEDNEHLKEALTYCKSYKNFVYPIQNDKIDTFFVGSKINNNDAMFIEFNMDNQEYIQIDHLVQYIYEIFKNSIEQTMAKFELEKKKNLFQKTFNNSEFYLYIVDNNKNIIFVNQKLRNLIYNQDENQTWGKCYKNLMKNEISCNSCPLDKVFNGSQTVRMVKDIAITEKKLTMDCAFIPIVENDRVYASSVFMYDITDRHLVWDALDELVRQKSSIEMENSMLKSLLKFGFSRVMKWQADQSNENNFFLKQILTDSSNAETNINDNVDAETNINDNVEFEAEKEKIGKNISVWAKSNINNIQLKTSIQERLFNTGFELHEHNENKSKKSYRPDFWINLPFLHNNEINLLISLDNLGDNNKDNETIKLNRLQNLESFRRTAEQILSNALQREYLKTFHIMLSHGIKGPLQVIRMNLPFISDEDEFDERKKFEDVADANLQMVQSSLASLLSIERGEGGLIIKKIQINQLILNQLNLFKAYAQNFSQIDIILNVPDTPIYCYTDETILIQILNNIVENSIRHLKRHEVKTKNKIVKIDLIKHNELIEIQISDNGNGLPQEMIKFFKKPFTKDMPYPPGKLGLGLSRAMASLLEGKLKLADEPLLGQGTTFLLFIKCRRKE